MNKKFILRLLLRVTVSLFFFNSCRTDEAIQEEKRTEREKIEAFSRFESNLDSQKHTQKNSEYISYHEPFKEIIQTFMNNNPVFTQKFQNEVGEIYFNLRSITYGETTKGIAYPIIKDGSVNAVLVGLVTPKRDWVNFIVLKNNSPEVQSMISNFQNVYHSPSIVSRGGQPEQTEDILPVIITVYGDITGPVNHYYQPYVDYGSNGGGMSGGSETYGGSGGGSQTQNPQDPKNPCEKTTGIITNTTVKAKIDELKAQSTLGGEKGVKFKVDGTPSEIIPGLAHSVNFKDKTGYAGGYHNHTPTGIPMLSPNDIDQLLGFARAQPTSNPANVNNAYVGMVAPNGMHYVIWFNGTYENAVTNFSQEDLNKYKKKYIELESNLTDEAKNGMTYMNGDGTINNLGVEKLFFETLKDMGLEGKVNLQRIENDGTVKNINLNANNQPISSTC
ncbi:MULTISPECIES: hypothetical protein [unclassified Chryseobacterium]|uniref:hypothetical protein n=1 Tax=unclassified Chryseobacterium TaxID=2593645 RepID=UPI0028536184|nr:hypothetical protein [Chryseobacterium sp. CFS7]MDR4893824.1 hypothetical protein [Chryseobacterium sp. CFS7]